MRERRGLALPFVFCNEGDAIAAIGGRVAPSATIHADEARGWDALHDRFLTKRINHPECYSDGDACTNQAESFFSRLRRAELSIHHHISGRYLAAYAGEMAWRENNRRVSNGGSVPRGEGGGAHCAGVTSMEGILAEGTRLNPVRDFVP